MARAGDVELKKPDTTLVSPSLRLAHLPHCTRRCRPETRDGLSTSRLRRPGTAGCRAALRSGESLKLSLEGKRVPAVPARRASGPELGSQSPVSGSCVATRRSRDSAAAGRQTARSPPAASGRATESKHAVAAETLTVVTTQVPTHRRHRQTDRRRESRQKQKCRRAK